MQARLAFARTGEVLACADEDGVTVLAGASRKRIALAGARAIAMAGDQLWIAAPGRLVRSTLEGRILDERAIEATPHHHFGLTVIVAPPAPTAGRRQVPLSTPEPAREFPIRRHPGDSCQTPFVR